MKKLLKRFISVGISLALLFEMIPFSALALEEEPEEVLTAEAEISADSRVLAEDYTLRRESTKYFALSDGSFTAVQYPFPVHYSAGSSWEDYDNTPVFVEEENFHGYLIKNGEESKYFSADGENPLYSVSSASASASFSLLPKESEELNYSLSIPEKAKEEGPDSAFFPEKLTSQIQYEEILPGISLDYTLYGPSIKENIILTEAPADPAVFFKMVLSALTVNEQEDGSILLAEEDGTPAWTLDAPYLYDAAGSFSTDIYYSLEKAEELEEGKTSYLLSLHADPEWLANAEYPVTIDPPLTRHTNGSGSNQPIYTTFVREQTPNGTGFGQIQYWGWGCSAGTGQMTGIARVNELPDIPAGGVMAYSTISYYFDSFSGAGMTKAKLGVREITSNLPSSYSSWYSYITNLTWNTKPAIADDFLDTVVVSNATVGRVEWDITRVVKKWYETPASNRGLAFDITNPEDCSSNVGACGRFYGYANTWYPIFTVNYRDTVGIEDYYTCQELPVDRAGTAYIGDYTGQITLIRTDATLASTVMPGSVSHVYNSAFATEEKARTMDGTGMKLGKGWSLDGVQSVKTINNVLTYTDGDGTQHAFVGSGPYYDEDGLGLTLKKTASSPISYELSNDKGEKLKFINGLLYEESDSFGNTIQYRYNGSNNKPAGTSSDRLNSVVLLLKDSSTPATVASFTWASDGSLSSITDYAGNSTSYSYTNGYLTTVTQPDGKTVSYAYDSSSGKMVSAQDLESGYKQTFGWSAGTVSQWKEFDGSTAGIGVTAVRTTKSAEYTFDGRTPETPKRTSVYLFDYAGRTVNIYTRNADGSIVYNASSGEYTPTLSGSRRNNRITVSGSMGIAENSLLSNGDFESGSTGWSITAGSVNSSVGRANTKGLLLQGNPNTDAKATITASNLNVSGKYSYMLAGWAKAAAMPNGGSVTEEVFDLKAVITYTDNSTEEHSQSFNTDVTDWQYLGFAVVPKETTKTVSSIQILCEYLKNNGNAYFDNITLTRELAQTYVYDDDGNLTKVSDGQTGSPVYSFNGTGDLTSFTSRAGVHYDYTYGDYHNLTSVTDGTVTLEASYDSYGNVTATALSGEGSSSPQSVSSFQVTVTENSASVYSSPGGSASGSKTLGTVLTITQIQKTGNILYGKFGTNTWIKLSQTNYRSDDTVVSVTSSAVNIRTGPGTNYTVMDSVHAGDKLVITETASGSGYTWGKIKANGYWLVLSYTNYSSVHGTTGGSGNPVWTGGEDPGLKSTASFSVSGNSLQSKEVDGNGAATNYIYGNSLARQYGLPTAITGPNGVTESRTYNSQNGRITQSAVSGFASLNYLYNTKGLLSGINRTFTRNGSSQTQNYSMTYGDFGDPASFSVGNRTLASYSYNQITGDLQTLNYGNNQYSTYIYNDINQLVQLQYNGNAAYSYSYDASGRMSGLTDSLLGRSYSYQYDSLDRLISSSVSNSSSSPFLTTSADYDSSGRLSSLQYRVNGSNLNYSYSYNDLSLPSSETTPSGTVSYSYDGLERLSRTTAGTIYTRDYSYATPYSTAGTTTGLVSSLIYKKANGTSLASFSYSYDSMGRISAEGNRHYTYDSLGQLTRVSDGSGNTLESYSYDGAGNLLTANRGGTTHTYSYGDSDWKDLLTSFDGQTITYDAIGNPTNVMGFDLTWEKGRQLASIGNSYGSIHYSYDANGLRTQKVMSQGSSSVTVDYVYDGSTLLQQRSGSDVLNFVYTNEGTPYALRYSSNGGSSFTDYYYLTNLQGDVISILNSSGTAVVTYSYDSWGSITSTSGTMASSLGKLNPLRYRGYCYDEETGLYYVSSRYYDPEVGRFINADGYISTGQGLLGYNMFAYCLNNPVNMQDPFGEIAITTLILIGSIVAGCLAVGHTAATSYKYTGKVDVGNTILAGVGTFLTVYTWGMSAYTAYLTYCDYKGYTPVTNIGKTNTNPTPYSNLTDPKDVAPGKDFTAKQKIQIIEQNKARNHGVVKSDLSGKVLTQPQKSMKGITPPPDEWQIDHITPKSAGGTNSFSNAQVLSRDENRIKWDN